LRAAAARGAKTAAYILVRLPGAVEPLFVEWLKRALPLRASKVLSRLREVRGGRMSDSRFGSRMSGEGKIAESIQDLFHLTCRRCHLNEQEIELSTRQFKRPSAHQPSLF
jgi:DNA repair photolyase